MSVLTRQPKNTNLLGSTKFKFVFSKAPHVDYFVQAVDIPGIQVSPVEQTNPFAYTYRTGDKPLYEPLTLTMLIDEEMRTWEEIHNWMRGISFPTSFTEYDDQKQKGLYSDATLIVESNANVPKFSFIFYHLFPITLSTVHLDSRDNADNLLTADVTFQYTYYDLKRLTSAQR